MNTDEIETFLAVVQMGSMKRAAEVMYISQGTVSTRISGLEQKLGVVLFSRAQGLRHVQLTSEGRRFASIAQQMHVLATDANTIREHRDYQDLRIAAADHINVYLLTDFYQQYIARHPKIFLTCQSEHATEIHELIAKQQMDLGFTFNLHQFSDVIAVPLYQESYAFVFDRRSLFARTREIGDLEPMHEVYGYWSQDFIVWHNRLFKDNGRKKIITGTASMMLKFLTEKTDWTIVPMSIAKEFCATNPNFDCLPANQQAPLRTAYVLSHKHPLPETQRVIDSFVTELKDFIVNSSVLKLLTVQ